jgi:hypothetical protein
MTPEEGIGIPISLDGFTAGFEALGNPPAGADATVEPPEPRAPVETSTRVIGATGPTDPPSFEIPADDRTALDRLLEDDLFPWVAAAAGGLVLVLLGGLVLALSGRRRRRRRRARAAREPVGKIAERPVEDPQPRPEAEADDADDDDEDIARPRRPAARRAPERLAGPPEHRQLPHDPLDELEDVVVARTGRTADQRRPRPKPRR